MTTVTIDSQKRLEANRRQAVLGLVSKPSACHDLSQWHSTGGRHPLDSELDDDAILVRQMAAGSSTALATLYDRHSQLLMTVAVRMLGRRAAAEDLVHDVFLEAWRNAAGYKPNRASVRTWLLVRLRSRALDRLRSRNVRRDAHQRIKSERPPANTQAVDLSAGVERRAIRHALSQLTDAQRTVLEMAYFQGLSSTEIATAMGSPVGTVKSRTASALRKLREAMASIGEEP